jgi:hypothetical protein
MNLNVQSTKLFASLSFSMAGFLTLSYFIFWKPLLTRWLF